MSCKHEECKYLQKQEVYYCPACGYISVKNPKEENDGRTAKEIRSEQTESV